MTSALTNSVPARTRLVPDQLIFPVCSRLRSWIEARDFAGHEPFDLLNSPFLQRRWLREPPLSYCWIQFGKRLGGQRVRQWLQVPPSRNPKALGLLLAGYCDLQREGEDCASQFAALKRYLVALRSPNEQDYCWGYDWDYVSLRGAKLPAFAMNAVATCFCAEALLDLAEITGDGEALRMGLSAARALTNRLNRSADTSDALCFSYTPQDRLLIFNSSALVAGLLSRAASRGGDPQYLELAQRAMRYLTSMQRPDGSWFYGTDRRHHWIDSFHTGYNLCALLEYRNYSGDASVDEAIEKGYAFYRLAFFLEDGTPKYFASSVYPIDIHACAHAIVTFCAFRARDAGALAMARKIANWTMASMLSPDGSFYFQRHRLWINRTPYMRWGQAWMFHALTRLLREVPA